MIGSSRGRSGVLISRRRSSIGLMSPSKGPPLKTALYVKGSVRAGPAGGGLLLSSLLAQGTLPTLLDQRTPRWCLREGQQVGQAPSLLLGTFRLSKRQCVSLTSSPAL